MWVTLVANIPRIAHVRSKRKQHRINLLLLRFCSLSRDVLNSYWLKTLVELRPPKKIGSKSRGILGTCGNQYWTGRLSLYVGLSLPAIHEAEIGGSVKQSALNKTYPQREVRCGNMEPKGFRNPLASGLSRVGCYISILARHVPFVCTQHSRLTS